MLGATAFIILTRHSVNIRSSKQIKLVEKCINAVKHEFIWWIWTYFPLDRFSVPSKAKQSNWLFTLLCQTLKSLETLKELPSPPRLTDFNTNSNDSTRILALFFHKVLDLLNIFYLNQGCFYSNIQSDVHRAGPHLIVQWMQQLLCLISRWHNRLHGWLMKWCFGMM